MIVGPQSSGKSSLRTWLTEHRTRTLKREELQYLAPTWGLEIQNHRLTLVPPAHLRNGAPRPSLANSTDDAPSTPPGAADTTSPLIPQETFCSMWDFSGNPAYRFMQQYFMSPFIGGVCILAFSLAEWPSQQAEILEWLQLLEARAKGTAIILVGTHLDKVDSDTLPALLAELIEFFRPFDTSSLHVVDLSPDTLTSNRRIRKLEESSHFVQLQQSTGVLVGVNTVEEELRTMMLVSQCPSGFFALLSLLERQRKLSHLPIVRQDYRRWGDDTTRVYSRVNVLRPVVVV